MGKETTRPTSEKETAKKKRETGKQEGVLADTDLESVTGAGLDSYVLEQQRRLEESRRGGGS